MLELSTREKARRQAVENPTDLPAMFAAEWPPFDRESLVKLRKSVRRGIVMPDKQLAVHLSRRIQRFTKALQHRIERYRRTKTWTAVAPSGLSVQFPLNDFASVEFKNLVDKHDQFYERTLIDFVASRIEPGDVFVDVGANVGYVSAFIAKAGAAVFAMEIQRDLLPLIEQVATINNIDHLRVLHVGASSRAGLSMMPRIEANTGTRLDGSGFFHVSPRDPRSLVDDFVPVIALDDAFLEAPLLPKVIKIDVEGHEIDVLQGARGIITAGRTTFVVEYHAHLLPVYRRRPNDLLDCFDLDRWSMFQLTDAGLRPLASMQDIRPDDHDPNPKLVFEPRGA